MLCERCWIEDTRVHFACLTRGQKLDVHLCLACAQDEAMSWLLAWAHRLRTDAAVVPLPAVVRVRGPLYSGRRQLATLVATERHTCACGCQIVLGAELPCRHAHPVVVTRTTRVMHTCHCGRDHVLLVPHVACADCGAQASLAIIATAQTCLHDEQRRRIVAVEDQLQHGRTSWGTVSLNN
jgi:hypothetical protein